MPHFGAAAHNYIRTAFFGNCDSVCNCADVSVPDADVPGFKHTDMSIEIVVADGGWRGLFCRPGEVRHPETDVFTVNFSYRNRRSGGGVFALHSDEPLEIDLAVGFEGKIDAGAAEVHPTEMNSLPAKEHFRRDGCAQLLHEGKGVGPEKTSAVSVFRIRICIDQKHVFQFQRAGGLEIDRRERDVASEFVANSGKEIAHQPVLHARRLHGHCCRHQQQYHKSEDPYRYVFAPFRTCAIIVIYKNKK